MSIRDVLNYKDEELLESINQTAKWLEENEIIKEEGLLWRLTPELESDEDRYVNYKCFYGGSSGIAFFFLRLYLVTKEEKWLDKAIRAADYIINTYEKDDFEASANVKGMFKGGLTSYYTGTSGQAYFVENLYQVLKENNHTDSEKYHQFVLQVGEDLLSSQIIDNGKGTWTGTVSAFGDGSITLFLVYLFEVTGDQRYIEAAKRSGYYFVDKAEKTDEGIKWYAMDTVDFGLGENGYFPNFFYGAAGNSYILAVLYKYTHEAIFLDVAKEGVLYVESVAVNKGNGSLIPYNIPYGKEIFYLGMCQGPVGTTRVFKLLYSLTEEAHYKEYTLRLLEGLLDTGAPLIHSTGYWHTYCYCCGAAGMLELFIGTDQFFNIEDYYNDAKDAAIKLIGDSYLENGKRRWYSAWTRITPRDVETYTGLFHGTTGCANALLTLYNERNDKIKLPGFLEDYWITK